MTWLRNLVWFRAFKVGGIWFIQLGRFQFSYCVCRRNPWHELQSHHELWLRDLEAINRELH